MDNPLQNVSPQYYEQIVQSLTSGVIAIDACGTIIMANSAAGRHLDMPENALHSGLRYQEVPLPENFKEALDEAIKQQTPISRREIVLSQADASAKEIGLSISIIGAPDAFQGIVVLFVDMTERRALERAAELNRQLAQVGELAAGVVHEVRNPLSVITGTVELLQRKLSDATPQHHLQIILSELKNIESAINGFLGFARPFDLVLSACRANDVIQRAYQLCKTNAEKKGVKLVIETNARIPEMHADAAKLAQALSNIISNGIDAAGGGAVHVSVSYSQGEVCFQISDTGPGITVPRGKNIFAPFFTQKAGGTGLGLAICHRIVTAHGGKITYTCPPEGGTHFCVSIPIRTTWDLDGA